MMGSFIPYRNPRFLPFRRFHQRLQQQLHQHLTASSTAVGDANPLHILWQYQILDPDSDIVTYWNYVFLITSIIALFIDPLFFFLPYTNSDGVCLTNDNHLVVLITYFRSIADVFFVLHIFLKFRTAFVAPSSRVFGRGELVMDAGEISRRYLRSDFLIDFAAALPLPQIVIWVVIPATRDSRADHANNTLALMVLFQYIPRLFLMFPLHQQIVKSTGFVAKTAWAGAVYNLLLFMLASHTLGASWYLLSLGRHFYCWKIECLKENRTGIIGCMENYLDCSSLGHPDRQYWRNITRVPGNCNPGDENIEFKYGIFAGAFINGVASSTFTEKYLYCLWWGLRNLSSYAQNLETSTFLGENLFCIITCIIGLILSAQLIGNMQTNLQSMTVRVEEWRIKRRDTEEWMRHRQLPPDLQERVRKFVQYQWLATRGVHEESILRSLPLDLRREIQRHLCLSLVRRVPFFSQMDDQLLDAICERLASSLSTEGTFIFREDEPVNEMLFVIRGQLESSTTNGGRSGFFNSITLRPGDFCGEELLTWALMPNPSANLPSSTRTVRALSEVEAFALQADDLIFVAQQFKRLQSKKLQHAFRYYSHQWRTWGACLIQSSWRRYQKRRMARELASQEEDYYNNYNYYEQNEQENLLPKNSSSQHLGTMLSSKFGGKSSDVGDANADAAASATTPELIKPDEPDFYTKDV
ncbi:cyclic nucleotide-gated ion channel 18-like [Euphorbia lathyris]|uniref:cyclic nucleotide-gated ion channel 18-like n=1 Tax=Euphorbia lathyris TaxID=212925 RepID=UPI003313648B